VSATGTARPAWWRGRRAHFTRKGLSPAVRRNLVELREWHVSEFVATTPTTNLKGGDLMNTALRGLLAAGAVYASVGLATAVASTEPPGSPADEAMDDSMVEAPVAVSGQIHCGPEV
jgi:hypothetical protein